MPRTNALKGRLGRGETAVGSFVNLPSPEAAELLGWTGFDFVIIDAEHGPADVETVSNMVRAVESTDATPIVRIAMNHPQNALRHLDTGAQGLQVPMVNTVEDARLAVRATLYPPQGSRGLAGVRAATFGLAETVAEYAETANDQLLVIVQIETVEALSALDAILEVGGVDIVFFGATDLSSSMGIPGRTTAPRVVQAIADGGEKVMGAGRVAGTIVGSPEAAREWRARGFRYIATNFAGLFGQAARQFLTDARQGEKQHWKPHKKAGNDSRHHRRQH